MYINYIYYKKTIFSLAEWKKGENRSIEASESISSPIRITHWLTADQYNVEETLSCPPPVRMCLIWAFMSAMRESSSSWESAANRN